MQKHAMQKKKKENWTPRLNIQNSSGLSLTVMNTSKPYNTSTMPTEKCSVFGEAKKVFRNQVYPMMTAKTKSEFMNVKKKINE